MTGGADANTWPWFKTTLSFYRIIGAHSVPVGWSEPTRRRQIHDEIFARQGPVCFPIFSSKARQYQQIPRSAIAKPVPRATSCESSITKLSILPDETADSLLQKKARESWVIWNDEPRTWFTAL